MCGWGVGVWWVGCGVVGLEGVEWGVSVMCVCLAAVQCQGAGQDPADP